MEKWREQCKLLRSCGKKNDDRYLALLDYRTTPLPEIDLSPAQLLMGRRLRNKLPMMESLLQPASNNQQEISRYLENTKESQRKYHVLHASREMKELQPGTKVCMQPWTNSKVWKPATIVKHHHTPRSYVVQAEDGRKYRCNRQHLRVCPAPGHGGVNAELPSCADQIVVQDKEPPRDAESTKLEFPSCCQTSHPRSKTCPQNQQMRTLRIAMSPEAVEK